MTDEAELLRAIACGDQKAFEALYTARRGLVAAFISRRLSDYGQAEETVIDTWAACWLNAGSYRGESSVVSWLLGIARYQVLIRYRASGRHPQMLDIAKLPWGATDLSPGPEASAVGDDTHRRLLEAVADLPPKLYETAMLAWVEELPYGEIAQALGIPLGTVKSRISLARQTLQKDPRVTSFAEQENQ